MSGWPPSPPGLSHQRRVVIRVINKGDRAILWGIFSLKVESNRHTHTNRSLTQENTSLHTYTTADPRTPPTLPSLKGAARELCQDTLNLFNSLHRRSPRIRFPRWNSHCNFEIYELFPTFVLQKQYAPACRCKIFLVLIKNKSLFVFKVKCKCKSLLHKFI